MLREVVRAIAEPPADAPPICKTCARPGRKRTPFSLVSHCGSCAAAPPGHYTLVDGGDNGGDAQRISQWAVGCGATLPLWLGRLVVIAASPSAHRGALTGLPNSSKSILKNSQKIRARLLRALHRH